MHHSSETALFKVAELLSLPLPLPLFAFISHHQYMTPDIRALVRSAHVTYYYSIVLNMPYIIAV